MAFLIAIYAVFVGAVVCNQSPEYLIHKRVAAHIHQGAGIRILGHIERGPRCLDNAFVYIMENDAAAQHEKGRQRGQQDRQPPQSALFQKDPGDAPDHQHGPGEDIQGETERLPPLQPKQAGAEPQSKDRQENGRTESLFRPFFA